VQRMIGSPSRGGSPNSGLHYPISDNAEEKLSDITRKLQEVRLLRRQLSPVSTKKKKLKKKSDSNQRQHKSKVTREYFHPQLEYVIAEVAHSPYMISPTQRYPEETLQLSGKIRNLKALGKRSNELRPEERPCDFGEARKIFTKIINFRQSYEAGSQSIDSNDRIATAGSPPRTGQSTQKRSPSPMLKAAGARGGPARYARRIKLIKEQRSQSPTSREDNLEIDFQLKLEQEYEQVHEHEQEHDHSSIPTIQNIRQSYVDKDLGSDHLNNVHIPPSSNDKMKSLDEYSQDAFEDSSPVGKITSGLESSMKNSPAKSDSYRKPSHDGTTSENYIYDDDEDFESFISNKVMQHSTKQNVNNSKQNHEEKTTLVQSIQPILDQENRSHSFGKIKMSGPNGDISDLEDSVN
jgi:hypothetical protein